MLGFSYYSKNYFNSIVTLSENKKFSTFIKSSQILSFSEVGAQNIKLITRYKPNEQNSQNYKSFSKYSKIAINIYNPNLNLIKSKCILNLRLYIIYVIFFHNKIFD